MNAATEHSYEPFALQPEYVAVNRLFIASLPIEGKRSILDLACGTGLISRLIAEQKPPAMPFIAGADLSWESLLIARNEAGPMIDLLRCTADVLPVASSSFDVVIIANAIQLVPRKYELVSEVARVLRPGGVFALNTSFYSGTYVPGTERFYLMWAEEALRWMMCENAERRSRGLPPIARRKTLSRSELASPWLSADEYVSLIQRCGFQLATRNERVVHLDKSSFESIGSYSGLASVLLDGYPVEFACEALRCSVARAFERAGLERIPRHWFECVGIRTRQYST
jgi:ubiquinone/menaquinone biosynthesis C-methylase UbiE